MSSWRSYRAKHTGFGSANVAEVEIPVECLEHFSTASVSGGPVESPPPLSLSFSAHGPDRSIYKKKDEHFTKLSKFLRN